MLKTEQGWDILTSNAFNDSSKLNKYQRGWRECSPCVSQANLFEREWYHWSYEQCVQLTRLFVQYWLITLNIVSLVKSNLVQLWEQPIQSDQIRQNLAQFEKFLRILRVCLVVGQNFEYSLPNAFCCWTNFHCCKWPSIEKNNHLVTLQQPYIEFSVVKCTNVKVHLHYD